jgi:hypothetical protein
MRKGKIDAQRVQRLNDLGIVWSNRVFVKRNRAKDWQDGYPHLLRFAEREGHARVVRTHTESGFELGKWVSRHREMKRKGELESRFSVILARHSTRTSNW